MSEEEPKNEDSDKQGVRQAPVPVRQPRSRTRSLGFSPDVDQIDEEDHHEELENTTARVNGATAPQNTLQSSSAIEDYYRRNPPANAATYDRQTDTARIPDYSKQFDRQDTVLSRRSRVSNVSRRGLPQVPQATPTHGFRKSFFAYVSKHRKGWLRYLLILMMVPIYCVIGAYLMWKIERPVEIQLVTEAHDNLKKGFEQIASDIAVMGKVNRTYIEESYVKLLKAEGIFKWTVFYKIQNPEWGEPMQHWTFWRAVYFVMAIYTAGGYGNIIPKSDLGRLCVVLYAWITIPLSFVVIRGIGQLVLIILTTIYARIVIKIRAVLGYFTTETENIRLPVTVSFLLAVGFMFWAGYLIHLFDEASGPPGTAISTLHGAYYTFISVTTVGMGDLLPNNVEYSPIVMFILFTGMPLLRVVNRVTFIYMENTIFGLMVLLENAFNACCGTSKVEPAGDTAPTQMEAAKRADEVGSTKRESDESEDEDDRARRDLYANFTVRSIATFIRSRDGVYGGDFGRVNVLKSDLQ